MNFFRRTIAAVLVAASIIFNRYEGGQRWGNGRSLLPGEVQDARFDAAPDSRLEMVRKARYWEQNSGLFNRLADLFEQYTVGANGLQFVPNSKMTEWNEAASTFWNSWSELPDLTSRQCLASLQTLSARGWFTDGEAFIRLTFGESATPSGPGRPRFTPRIQLIESHRVETPPNKHDTENIIDGIQVDERGRPTFYWVKDGLKGDRHRPIPADEIVHIFEPSRPGQLRGLPLTYAVLNLIHSFEDLKLMEMKAAAANADIANVVTNEAGEVQGIAAIRRSVTTGNANQDSAGNDTVETRTAFYASRLGGRTVALKKGDKLDVHRSDRPSASTQWHWDYTAEEICVGVGIPKILVFPGSMQGTVVRADLDVAAGFFRSRSTTLIAAWKTIYVWVMRWAKDNVPELKDAPDDWDAVTTRAPRAVNVDVGRNSAAMLAELAAGTTTFQAIYAERGEDWRQQLRQVAVEAKFLRELAKEFGLEVGEISDKAVKAMAALMPKPEQVPIMQRGTA